VGYLTPALVDGRWLVRISIAAPATERDDVEAIWAAFNHTPAQLWKQAGPRPVGNSIRDELRHAKLPQGPHLHTQEDLAAAQRKATEVNARLHFLRLGHLL
jgi:hypothetical protein